MWVLRILQVVAAGIDHEIVTVFLIFANIILKYMITIVVEKICSSTVFIDSTIEV